MEFVCLLVLVLWCFFSSSSSSSVVPRPACVPMNRDFGKRALRAPKAQHAPVLPGARTLHEDQGAHTPRLAHQRRALCTNAPAQRVLGRALRTAHCSRRLCAQRKRRLLVARPSLAVLNHGQARPQRALQILHRPYRAPVLYLPFPRAPPWAGELEPFRLKSPLFQLSPLFGCDRCQASRRGCRERRCASPFSGCDRCQASATSAGSARVTFRLAY